MQVLKAMMLKCKLVLYSAVQCLVAQSCLTLRLYELQPARLLCPWGFPRQEYWSGVPCPPPGDLPNPGFKPRSPTLQVDSLLPEPRGKPKNTGVGNLSLLQRIFPTQESKQDLLHCRWIVLPKYYLSKLRIRHWGQNDAHGPLPLQASNQTLKTRG